MTCTASEVQMDPAEKNGVKGIAGSSCKNDDGHAYKIDKKIRLRPVFFYPGKNVFLSQGKNDLAKMRIRVILLGNGIRQ